MSMDSPKPKRRLPRWPLALLLILLGIFALLSSLCSTVEITDDPARNGGFTRGRILVLQQPIAVSASGEPQYAVPLSESHDPANTIIPAGTRLEIEQVRFIRQIVAD